MSYMKKDEDADQVMIKLDRTSVFQDGIPPNRVPPGARTLVRGTQSTHVVLTDKLV
jgi:hypothetical protein